MAGKILPSPSMGITPNKPPAKSQQAKVSGRSFEEIFADTQKLEQEQIRMNELETEIRAKAKNLGISDDRKI